MDHMTRYPTCVTDAQVIHQQDGSDLPIIESVNTLIPKKNKKTTIADMMTCSMKEIAITIFKI